MVGKNHDTNNINYPKKFASLKRIVAENTESKLCFDAIFGDNTYGGYKFRQG